MKYILSKVNDLGAKMSIGAHYLSSHLDRFLTNLGDQSE